MDKDNTRPQPAPPEGEPDEDRKRNAFVRDVALGTMVRLVANYDSQADHIGDSDLDDEQSKVITWRGQLGDIRNARTAISFMREVDSLGLAGRPKEVVRLIGFLRSKWHGATLSQTNEELMAQAADLLERLAEEVAQYKRAECCHFENAAELESKLAEREAELAQMQRERDGERETRERASDALMAKDEAIGVLIEIAGPQACQRAMDILDERRAARQQQKN